MLAMKKARTTASATNRGTREAALGAGVEDEAVSVIGGGVEIDALALSLAQGMASKPTRHRSDLRPGMDAHIAHLSSRDLCLNTTGDGAPARPRE